MFIMYVWGGVDWWHALGLCVSYAYLGSLLVGIYPSVHPQTYFDNI